MTLKGKLVFVTGASSGIGAATVRALAAEGVRVTATARRAERLAEVSKRVREESMKVNAEFAAKAGIKNGQVVILENQDGAKQQQQVASIDYHFPIKIE